MRPDGVIVISPFPDFAARLPKVPKPARIQALIPQAAVEALDRRVLYRLTRLDVGQLNPMIDAPGEKVPRSEFAPVVPAE